MAKTNREKSKTFFRPLIAIGLFLVLPILIGVACELQFFNIVQLDDYCELYQFKVLSGVVAKPLEVRLVGAGDLRKPGAEQKLRGKYAELIDRFHKANAHAVIFDLYFLAPDPSHQEEEAHFADAIQATTNGKSFHVLIGTPGNYGKMSPTLEKAVGPLQLGSLRTGGERNIWGTPYLRRFILAEQSLNGNTTQTRFSLDLKAILAEFGWNTEFLTGDFHPYRRLLVVRGGTSQLWLHCDFTSNMDGTLQAVLPIQLVNYQQLHNEGFRTLESLDSDDLTAYQGRLVLVGDRTDTAGKEKPDYYAVLPQLKAYGVEIDASILNDLLIGKYPRRLPTYWEIVVLFVIYWVAAIFRRFLPQWPLPVALPYIGGKDAAIPIGLVCVWAAYAVVACLLYRAAYVYIDVLYPVLASACGYFLLGSFLWKQKKSLYGFGGAHANSQ